MARYVAFRYCLDPTATQDAILGRHAGASRFAFNQRLRMVKSALDARRTEPNINVPWTGFDLVNEFNAWKKSEDAGRVLTVARRGVITVEATGLNWRSEVCQQVFEEAAIDCGRALAAWSRSRAGTRSGKRVGFPRFKKKTRVTPSFRLRNKQPRQGKALIRIGETHSRSVTLPAIGAIRVYNDTRPLRRLVKAGAKIRFVTVCYRAGRWWLTLNLEASDLHPARRHRPRNAAAGQDWVGVDLGLKSFLVAARADGTEVARIERAPKPLAVGIRKQRRLAKSLSRKERDSNRRKKAVAELARHHNRIRSVRFHFLHQVANDLVNTHDHLVLEDLNVSGLLANHRLARAIADAGWAEFGRILRYKQAWRDGVVVTADRWFASSKTCSQCGTQNKNIALSDRTFTCACGLRMDRDRNAAANLARWPSQNSRQTLPRTVKQPAGLTTLADSSALADVLGPRLTELVEAGTEVQVAMRPE